MKCLLILVTLVTALLSSPVQARPLSPGWRHIPGGVQKCVYDPDLRRAVCETRCGEAGWKLASGGRSCVRR